MFDGLGADRLKTLETAKRLEDYISSMLKPIDLSDIVLAAVIVKDVSKIHVEIPFTDPPSFSEVEVSTIIRLCFETQCLEKHSI